MTTTDPAGPRTLAIDVGGSGLKASVLSPAGEMVSERVRRPTPYPCPPETLLRELTELAAALPEHDRISVGFPGTIRRGRVRVVPSLSRREPAGPPDPKLVKAWTDFDLEDGLRVALSKPVRVANDADVQGSAVVTGNGLELVVTLGTGIGCALFYNGELMPHMEFSHGRFGRGHSIDIACGEARRARLGTRRWRRRVLDALTALEAMVLPDHTFVGGGNAKKLDPDSLGPRRSIVSNVSGLLGGIALWSTTGATAQDRAG